MSIEQIFLGLFIVGFITLALYFSLYGKEVQRAQKQVHLLAPRYTLKALTITTITSILLALFSGLLLLKSL